MNIKIIAVGSIKENYMKKGIEEFRKRLTRYCRLNIIEVKDEKAPEGLKGKEILLVKQKEAERIVKHIKDGDYVIALAIDGKDFTSEKFAKEMENLALRGKSSITFIIGGSLGLSDKVLKMADMHLSFSAFTFPHQLMRLILLEQIYRAYRIINGQPYHK
ncbi:MAG: 23S rRNA (pseudouridine(1915)-N(3))-methyltransferase RlmH [Clostridiales bacterium]|nr:23S rRNA (pseudouridine(1915)-N(3))-methyltransferase RlmH [Clostridiales bacterium]